MNWHTRPGDLVMVASGYGQSLLSWIIRRGTGSGFSHAQLVTRGGVAPELGFHVLEVGWRLREARAYDVLYGREFVVWRPSPDRDLGLQVAANALTGLAELQERGEDFYPWWKLPAYALGRSATARLVRAGPRQVCSVMSVYPWVAHGLPFYVWDEDARNYEQIDTDAEVRTVTPADVQRCAIERGWQRIYETPGAPQI